MKKNIINSLYGLAVASLMLTACSSADDAVTQSPAAAIDDAAINFGAYMNRTSTRGGWEGELTTAMLQTDANGFGVLAYYTDNQPYTPNAIPNFMYNQKVTYDNTVNPAVWSYSPLKYWPNELGATGTSEGDFLSFFAYAPYTMVDAVTGNVPGNVPGIVTAADYGIIGMTRAAESGNPKVRYVVNLDPSKQVDLCWASPAINKVKTDYATSGDGSQVQFSFNHALASLNVQIDAMFDEATPGANTLDPNTRIWVRSVTFDGLALKGELNLNVDGVIPAWNDLYSNVPLTAQPITIYDGRRDGREAIAAMPNEKPIGINSVLVQNVGYETNLTTITSPAATMGVTNTAVNLFEHLNAETPVYVIPTGVPLQVTIVYDVETFDANLVSSLLSDGQTNGVSVENTITKKILLDPSDADSGLILDAGFKYTVKLHLGMTSVKATATVTPWDDGDEVETNLPANN